MKRELTYIIQETDGTAAPLTVQSFLKSRGYSHAVIVSLKKTPEGILKNGVWARAHDPLLPGDCLQVRIVEDSSSDHIVPRPLPFPVVYEDEDLLVVNKPADMPIHPSQGNYENTLANAAAWYFKEKGESFVYRCINRLDRDTTGLLILARHAYSAALLSRMVSARQIKREYLAIERRVDFEHGEPARTHYELLYSEGGYSLVRLRLDTGRTHQIRVHMKYLGHPLPGDFLYCPDYTKIKRQALHSCRLSFLHPVTGHPLSFTAPLPDDMRSFFPSVSLNTL